MKIAIIVSKKDPAGMNILEQLRLSYPFKATNFKFENEPIYELDSQIKSIDVKLYITETDSVHCENIDKSIDADLFIFATKHQSKTKIPSLSAHTTGNWGKAEFGGKDRQLCVAPANYIKEAIIKLEELNKIKYEVVQECTHHGPFLEKPIMFIEIGSAEEQWKNKEAGKIIAETIHSLVTREIPDHRTAFGIGGLHTTPNFKKIILNTGTALGHVCPKYNLENLDDEMLHQALTRSTRPADIVILDWKGLKEHKQRIKELLEKNKIDYTRTDKF